MWRFRLAVLAAACSGKLTEGWRASLPPERVGRGDAVVEAAAVDEGVTLAVGSRLGSSIESDGLATNLPETWSRDSFGRLVENFDGRRVPVKSSDRERRRGKYPYYGASGVIDTINDYLFDGEFLLIAEDGANLLSRSTPIAFAASGKFWVNNHAHVVQPRAGIPIRWLEIFLNSLDLQHYVTGSAQPKLTQVSLNGIIVPVPPREEQHEIVRRVDALLALAGTIEKRVAASAARAEKLTQAVIAKAFRGDLVPTEAELARQQGRDYEPASVLLERIRQESGATPSSENSHARVSKHSRVAQRGAGRRKRPTS